MAKFVQSQIEMREEYKWRGSLRIGRQPSVDIINRGLKEFILHHNKLGDRFLTSLAERIKDDDYLRFIDIRYNMLSRNQVMTFLKTLHSNKYLIGIDFRGNKGYSDNDSVKTSVGLFLQRNLNLNLAMDVRLKDTWIIKE